MSWSRFARFNSTAHTSFTAWPLLSMALLDELVSGLPVVALPLIRDGLQLGYDQVGLIFTAMALSATLIEPPLNLLSDRSSKRWPVLGGTLGLVLGFALAASAPNFGWLLVAFAIIGPASGAAVGLSQATLIDRDIDAAPRTMVRWTLFAGVGDLLAPILVGAAIAIGFAWRSLFWLAALIWLAAAVLLWFQHFPARFSTETEEEQPEQRMLTSLQEALRTPQLLRWLIIVLLCTMLDEIFLGFAALFLRDVVRVDAATTSLALVAPMVGGMLGLLILNRVVGRYAPQRLLAWLAGLTLIGIIVLLTARTLVPTLIALFVVGLGAGGWYPVAKAAAYATLPGRSGTVRAVDTLLATPFEIALPLLVGIIAEQFGIVAGLGVLGMAPVALLLLLPWKRSDG